MIDLFSNVPRSIEYINRLLAFIQMEYQLDQPLSITPTKRGYYGETWRLDTLNNSYFIKLDYSIAHQSVYERSFPIIEHLNKHGISFISRIIKTSRGTLSAQFDGAVLGVFDWINGENVETDETKISEYKMLAKVYTISHDGLSIPVENFAGSSSDRFFEQWGELKNEQLCYLFEKKRTKLESRATRLKHFATMCHGDTTGFHITHGDAGGNLIVNGDRYYIVDWDDPIVAPPERDAWNMLCYRDWAKCVFHKSLRNHGIDYTIRPERLAYYCYYNFFFYLTEYLDGFTQLNTTQLINGIEQYFDGWTEDRAVYADNNF